MSENTNRGRERTAELIADMADQIEACLRSQLPEIGKDEARMVGRRVSRYMAQHWGGQNMYFPKDHYGRLSARDKEIWDKFNGHNQIELAAEYDLTMQHIYRILKAAAEHHRAKNQADLFGA